MGMNLSDAELARYEWQLDVPGFGLPQQQKLKSATVLVSRAGGVGGAAALYLAAAGIGKLIIAHGGNLQEPDLNRQVLMRHDYLGKPRVDCAAKTLVELNPDVQVETVAQHINSNNVDDLVSRADLVVDAAPRFEERLLMNHHAVRHGRTMVECAMYEMQLSMTVIIPGRTPCLACLFPEKPPLWNRRFPVFGAVSGVAGAMMAMEAIKVLCGLGEPLAGKMFVMDLRDYSTRAIALARNPRCEICGKL